MGWVKAGQPIADGGPHGCNTPWLAPWIKVDSVWQCKCGDQWRVVRHVPKADFVVGSFKEWKRLGPVILGPNASVTPVVVSGDIHQLLEAIVDKLPGALPGEQDAVYETLRLMRRWRWLSFTGESTAVEPRQATD